jgi:hypothetical protein
MYAYRYICESRSKVGMRHAVSVATATCWMRWAEKLTSQRPHWWEHLFAPDAPHLIHLKGYTTVTINIHPATSKDTFRHPTGHVQPSGATPAAASGTAGRQHVIMALH